MSYCINPWCPKPNDPANINNRLCHNCGSELLLQGRYQVMRLLSDSSGFGKVYEAYNGAIPKILKVLKQTHSDNDKVIELFQQEAMVLSQLNHPGIPRVESDGYFQFFPKTPNRTESLHCIIMEKIDGPNLQEWMYQQGNHAIGEKQALNWLKQLVEILHLVHQKNYFHRDIKPANIMLRSNGQLVLIDFGTARELTYTYLANVGGSGNVTKISSTGYTPPEQEKGHAVPQSDFYALGRTFVYLLTGKQATDPAIYDPLTDTCNWRQLAPNVSDKLANLIDKLMAPTAANRHKNTQEILDEIANIFNRLQEKNQPQLVTHVDNNTSIQSSENISVIKQQPGDSIKRWLIGGGAALAVILGGYGTWQFSPNYVRTASPLVKTIAGDGSYVNYLAISPDGKSLLSSSADKKIKIWDFSTGKEIRTIIEHVIPINYFAMTPDWKTVATGGSDNTIEIWDFSTRKKVRTLKGHLSYVNHIVMTPDGTKLASASADNTIKIWNFYTGKEISTLKGHSSYVNYLILTPDGKKLASASADNTIKIWDFYTGKEISTLSGHSGSVNSLAISSDGRKLVSASADSTIKIWDFYTGEAIRTLTGHSSAVKPVAITPDGKKLVSASADNVIKIWNLSTGKEIQTLKGHSSSVNSLIITPDGKKLVSASADGTIKIWRMPD